MQTFRIINGEVKEINKDIRPESNSAQRWVHMGEDVFNLYFEVAEPLDLRVNDFVVFGPNPVQKIYKFKKPPAPKKLSRHHFEYSCQLMGPQYDLQDALYVLADDTGVGELDDTIPIYGTLTFHLQQILRCVKEVHPRWEIGGVEDTGEAKNIVYNNMDCLEALQHLASEFHTEYWFGIWTVHMGIRKEEGQMPVFKYGKGNSFYNLARQNQDGRIVTKLLVKGGTRNIDATAYGHATLRLPGGGKYVMANEDKYGTIMGRQDFPDVYPRIIHKEAGDPGSVTAARANNYGIYYIKDANLGFNPADYMLPGLSIKVVFQTGQLAGIPISANWHSNTQEFELIRGDYGLGVEVPGSVFVPAVGNLYSLEDIAMPATCITAAENELRQKAEAAIAQLCEPKVSYKATCNPLFFKNQLALYLSPGQAVLVEDPDIVPDGAVELRIHAITRRVHKEYDIDLEISDTLYSGRISKIETAIREVQDELTDVDKSVRKFTTPSRPVFRGNFDTIPSAERIFYNNPNRRDSVWYNGQYYEYKGADNAMNATWIAGNWQPFQSQYGSLATDLLLAIGANIGGWIFNGEILESQSGNAWMNGKTGEVRIGGRFESNRNGNRIVIDPATRQLSLYRDDTEVGSFYFVTDEYGYGAARLALASYNGNTKTSEAQLSPELGLIFTDYNTRKATSYGPVLIFDLDKLPTSKQSLAIGHVWRDGDVLKVVTE